MRFFSFRNVNGWLFLSTLLIIAYSFYLQFGLNLSPCPLCILQRLLFIALSFSFLLGFLFYKKVLSRISWTVVSTLIALFGASIAGRQVWIQHLPYGQAPACGPSLYFVLRNWPFNDAIKMLLRGTAECSVITWRFLDLSLAEWSLILFIIFIGIGLVQLFRAVK